LSKHTSDFQDPTSSVFFQTQDRITHVYFNRPDRLNPFDLEMSERFAKLIKALHKEKSDVVILTGKGRAFSAGADLDFLEKCTREKEAKVRKSLRKLYANFLTVRDLKQVSIAQVNGAVAGGGLGLVLACDLRTVLASAKFAFNFVKIGLSPGMGILHMTAKILGESKARELWLRGRTETGAKVAQWGGACEVAESVDDLERVTMDLAREIRGNSKLGMEYIKKEMLWKQELEQYLEFNCKHQARCLKSPEAREGLRAIKERRAPEFISLRK
jgi:2-(1,2-epoxy-1,2-dihydrophenyl)acetyl-CoA isomerase